MPITKTGARISRDAGFSEYDDTLVSGSSTMEITVTGLEPSTNYYAKGVIEYNGQLYTSANTKEFTTEESTYSGFYIEDISGELNTVSIVKNNSSANTKPIYISYDGGMTWIDKGSTSTTAITFDIEPNRKVLVKSNSTAWGNTYTYNYITCNKLHNIGGDISTLAGGENLLRIQNAHQYSHLFRNNTKLVNANDLVLPATTLADYCYDYMFRNCTSLTSAPKLPATTLADYCYDYMFYGCTSLTSAPELPATTLADYCYSYMFYGCTSLTTAPELPATTLANRCYYNMFYGCTSLTTAPELPATTLTNYCYYQMFNGCSSLNYIKCLATNISASSCTDNWVSGVSETGTFVRPYGMTSWTTGVNGIPTGWKVEEYIPKGFYIEDISGELNTVGIMKSASSAPTKPISISYDGGMTWIDKGSTSTTAITFDIEPNRKVLVKSNSTAWGNTSTYNYITCNKLHNIGGDISSLSGGENILTIQNDCQYNNLFINDTNLVNANDLVLPATTLADYCYNYMFRNCTSLTSAPKLPATTLYFHCYYGMFDGCTSLTTAPELPATTLSASCYYNMFNGCTSLTSAPKLPATTLYFHCYYGMFSNCSSLTSAPELPATTLADYCYFGMFDGCTSLTTAPELTATTLAASCYYNMFRDCSSLNYIKCLATNISASSCTKNWVSGVASTGTFYAKSGVSWSSGVNGIPSGWTRVNV